MPREARRRQEKGIHHVVVQGRRKEQIFQKEEDKALYLETIMRYAGKTGVQIFGYCILENHAHLVMKETEREDVSGFMRRLGVSYAYWYRRQHPAWPRGKELFRGRYLSQPVESERQLLETVRYIHQEPVKRGLVSQMEDYRWSSYRLYLIPGGPVSSRLILDSLHFGGGYQSYMSQEAEGRFLEEVPVKYGRSDQEAREIAQGYLNGRPLESLAEWDEEERRNFLRKLRYEEGISIQQLSRITGISRGIIQRL